MSSRLAVLEHGSGGEPPRAGRAGRAREALSSPTSIVTAPVATAIFPRSILGRATGVRCLSPDGPVPAFGPFPQAQVEVSGRVTSGPPPAAMAAAVRVASRTPGLHCVQVLDGPDSVLCQEHLEITAVPSGDPRHRVRLGCNMSPPGGASLDARVGRTLAWLESFAGVGGGLIRLVLTSWTLGTLPRAFHLPPTEGIPLDTASGVDRVLERCRELDLAVVLALFDWSDFRVGRDWTRNPLFRGNGGPCRVPLDAFTSPEAVRFLDALVEDAVARWGAFRCVVGWEVFNEADQITGGHRPPVRRWLTSAVQRVRDADPLLRPVSFSHGNPLRVRDQTAAGVDCVHVHNYGWPSASPALNMAYWSDVFELSERRVPHLLSEFSFRPDTAPATSDPDGEQTRLGLWSALFHGWSNSGWPWYTETLDDLGLWHIWHGIARFTRAVGWGTGPRWRFAEADLAVIASARREDRSTSHARGAPGRNGVRRLAELIQRWFRIDGHRKTELWFYLKSAYVVGHLLRYRARRRRYERPLARALWRSVEPGSATAVLWLCPDPLGAGEVGPVDVRVTAAGLGDLEGPCRWQAWCPRTGSPAAEGELLASGGRITLELRAHRDVAVIVTGPRPLHSRSGDPGDPGAA